MKKRKWEGWYIEGYQTLTHTGVWRGPYSLKWEAEWRRIEMANTGYRVKLVHMTSAQAKAKEEELSGL